MIFEEPTGRRRRKVRLCFLLAAFVGASLACLAILNVVVAPALPSLPKGLSQHRSAVVSVSEPLSTPPEAQALLAADLPPHSAAVASETDPSIFGSPFVRCDGDLRLPKPVRNAILPRSRRHMASTGFQRDDTLRRILSPRRRFLTNTKTEQVEKK